MKIKLAEMKNNNDSEWFLPALFIVFGLFVIFFYFGFLKVIGSSPASPLVEQLFGETITFMSFGTFIILFGLFECLIGILFIIRGFERIVIPMLF